MEIIIKIYENNNLLEKIIKKCKFFSPFAIMSSIELIPIFDRGAGSEVAPHRLDCSSNLLC